MDDISRKIRMILEDYFDDIGLECAYNEKNSCYISPVVEFTGRIAAKAVQIVVTVYSDAFDLSVFCSGYSAVPEHRAETMIFIGLINNFLYPGTSIKYCPDGLLKMYRYVDCINTAGALPSIEKIHTNMIIVLSMYEKFIDMVVAVDQGHVSAIDAFKSFLEE